MAGLFKISLALLALIATINAAERQFVQVSRDLVNLEGGEGAGAGTDGEKSESGDQTQNGD